MAELVHGEKEHSDWFSERSEFCYTDRYDGPLTNWFHWFVLLKDIEKKRFDV